VDDFQLMQVVNTIDYLVEKAAGFTLSQSFYSKNFTFSRLQCSRKAPRPNSTP
jgi:hypothetical protein